MTLKVQRRQCSTCIFRPDSPLNLAALLRAVADPHMAGFFRGSRICHHSNEAVCAGFWARYKDKFTVGQVAQRLDLVEVVDHDTLEGLGNEADMAAPVDVGVRAAAPASGQDGAVRGEPGTAEGKAMRAADKKLGRRKAGTYGRTHGPSRGNSKRAANKAVRKAARLFSRK
jgi:hypothetical protein